MFSVLNGGAVLFQPFSWPGSVLPDLGALQQGETFLQGLGFKLFVLLPCALSL